MALSAAATDVLLDLRAAQEWLDIIDAFLTPALLALLVILTALWSYWRRERTRGRLTLILLVAGATLCLVVASFAPTLWIVAVGMALSLLMIAATRFAWSWITYAGPPESLHPLPEPLEVLEDIVIERVEAANEDGRTREPEPITKLNLRGPAEPKH